MEELSKIYLSGLSMADIARLNKVSVHKVVYWMDQYKIIRRTRSEATYVKKHPNGDPFKFNPPNSLARAKLLGIGLGLYWGEGTKANKTSIRLGNTDPGVIKTFVDFLVKIFSINRSDLKFGLQIFTDIDEKEALSYWLAQLGVERKQFYKTTITISGSLGTYRHKCKYGVVTVHYHNKKLRDILIALLPSAFNY